MGWKRNRGHRSDENTTEVVDALRAVGVLVWHIGRPCDLLCRSTTGLHLLDVDGITKNRKRDPKQLQTFAEFGVRLVKTPEDAFAAVGIHVDV